MAHCTSLENSSCLDERRHLQNAHPGPWLETHGTESWMALGPPSDQGPHSSCWSAGLTRTAWAEHIGRPSSWGLRGSSRRSVAKSRWTLRPHGLQHTRLPCPSLSPRVFSNPCPWVGDAIQPSRPLLLPLLLPSIFPSIRAFTNESAVCIRWPKFWRFSFSISPSNEYSGLISFRTA